ncbi:MAG: M1 family metallopeptidase [Bacteroidota bacterium]
MRVLLLTLLTFTILHAFPQANQFTRQDTLRGSITAERAWWDLTYYHLEQTVSIEDSSISGVNTIQYKVLAERDVMQVDLQAPMRIDKVSMGKQTLTVTHEGNAHFIHFPTKQKLGEIQEVKVYFSGQPKVSKNPPWDGGLSWKADSAGNPFVATSCQLDGASLWWPCKDHSYDEPDSMLMSITVPDHLMDVSNGRLRSVQDNKDGTKTWNWFVGSPINNYGVNINVADYAYFSDTYEGENGSLTLDYYVLKDNLEKAKEHFKQVKPMMEAFEYWFGPYPFYEDGYKLVEVPYWGMEHQSSVTYGNQYKYGAFGREFYPSGHGMKFDYIIIHESGHEWFANSITNIDVADMWIHESFTTYSENLFLDYHYGKQASSEYVIASRMGILNQKPIIGPYGVNKSGDGQDMYSKGANVLHTLRQLVDNDSTWREILRGLNKTFYHQTVSTQQIEKFIDERVELDLDKFFDQYLRDERVPIFEYRTYQDQIIFRWRNCIPGFDMPVKIKVGEQKVWIEPQTTWTAVRVPEGMKLEVDKNFYVVPFDISV